VVDEDAAAYRDVQAVNRRADELRASGTTSGPQWDKVQGELRAAQQKQEEVAGRRRQWRADLEAAAADPASLQESDYIAAMAALEGRKDMARGNAVKAVMRAAGLTGKAGEEQARRALAEIEASRHGKAHFAPGAPGMGRLDTTGGVTKPVDFLPADAVYRAAHRLASGGLAGQGQKSASYGQDASWLAAKAWDWLDAPQPAATSPSALDAWAWLDRTPT
jgi:hypothetical protein